MFFYLLFFVHARRTCVRQRPGLPEPACLGSAGTHIVGRGRRCWCVNCAGGGRVLYVHVARLRASHLAKGAPPDLTDRAEVAGPERANGARICARACVPHLHCGDRRLPKRGGRVRQAPRSPLLQRDAAGAVGAALPGGAAGGRRGARRGDGAVRRLNQARRRRRRRRRGQRSHVGEKVRRRLRLPRRLNGDRRPLRGRVLLL